MTNLRSVYLIADLGCYTHLVSVPITVRLLELIIESSIIKIDIGSIELELIDHSKLIPEDPRYYPKVH